MADIFIDGFDKYGPVGAAQVNASVLAGEWTKINSGSFEIVAGLSSTGTALQAQAPGTLVKTLAANYSRLIGGIRISSSLVAQAIVMQFIDAGTAQCTITVETSGVINLRTGNVGTILSGGATLSANSTHYIEWDITFGASAAYQVWLDGVSLFSGTGNTRGGTSNNYANQILLGNGNISGTITFDDFYLFDSTGGANNAVLNTDPRIETQVPSGDSSVQFSFGAAILGSAYVSTLSAATNAPGANTLFLRTFTPTVACVLNSVACIPSVANAVANFKSVLYADSAGAPAAPIATGTEVTGTIGGATLVSPFSSGQTLTASTAYWLGFITDTSVTLEEADTNLTGRVKSNTYGSGAPNPAGSMTTGLPSWLIYGNLTGVAVNYYEVAVNPPPGDISYVFASSSGFEDLYSFPALSTTPNSIYTVAVKGNIKKSDTGSRTVTLQCKSGTTDSTGSAAPAAPATSYGWIDSFFDTDPNTGIAWTPTGLNSATSGVKVAS